MLMNLFTRILNGNSNVENNCLRNIEIYEIAPIRPMVTFLLAISSIEHAPVDHHRLDCTLSPLYDISFLGRL